MKISFITIITLATNVTLFYQVPNLLKIERYYN